MTYRHRPPALPASGLHPTVIDGALVPSNRGAVAIMSSVIRDGDWILPRLFRAFTLWGSIELDLTSAGVGPGISQIEIVCLMGSVTVLVPPELRVQCDGDAIMGAFDLEQQVATAAAPDAPVVRIAGTAFWGAVEVKVVDPNAPGWFEKLRARWEASKRGR